MRGLRDREWSSRSIWQPVSVDWGSTGSRRHDLRSLVDAEQLVHQKGRLLTAARDERGCRLWAGAEADAIGRGGVAKVARATRLAISTVRRAALVHEAGEEDVCLVVGDSRLVVRRSRPG